MKNNFFLITLMIGLLVVTGCSSDDTTTIDNAALIKQIEDTIESGTWHITSYVDSGQNETNDYTGYNFTFNANGTLTASNGSNTINGTWSVTEDDDDSNDDNSNDDNDVDFNISFTSPPNFEELSDDWDIMSISNTKMELIDVSGGSGETDSLSFTKN